MRHRFTATAALTALALIPLNACSTEEPLAEPELTTQSQASQAPSSEPEESEQPEESKSPTTSASETPEESSDVPPPPEIGPDEVILEGTIKKLDLVDMVSPEYRENIQQYADQVDYDYYVIELDNPQPIEAPMGGAPFTKTPKYAQLAALSPGEPLGSEFEWMLDVGRKVRVIGDLNQMRYGSDIATPDTAVIVGGSQHPPQFLD